MSLEMWLAFVSACAVLSLIPGPSVLLVIGQALSRGITSIFLVIVGNMIGGVFLTILSLVGVGAILAASVTLFAIVKWAGVFYMAYMGYCQIKAARKNRDTAGTTTETISRFGSLKSGFFASTLNPKTVIFYVAFLSQFMDPGANQLVQMFTLMATSTTVAGLVLLGYALLANRARLFFQSKKARRNINYAGGGCLIGGSVMMAAVTR